MQIDSKTIASIRELLSEVMGWHSDPESPEYNECDDDQSLCMWCHNAGQVLESLDNPGGAVMDCKHEWVNADKAAWNMEACRKCLMTRPKSETFQIQPDPEPFDFEFAETLAGHHDRRGEIMEEKTEVLGHDLLSKAHYVTAIVLRDATERLKP